MPDPSMEFGAMVSVPPASDQIWQTGAVRISLLLTTSAAVVATVAGTGVVIAMASGAPKPQAADSFSMPSSAVAHLSLASGPSPAAKPVSTPTPMPSPLAVATAVPIAASAAPAVVPAATPKFTPKPVAAASPKKVVAAPPPAAPTTGVALPLSYSTGSATKVITVVAKSTASTTAVLQAWSKAPNGGWLRYGAAVTAHVGSQGMTASPSEGRSSTPMGSYSLTRAFGALANPGTPLPYLKTSAADWWISEVNNPLYNTLQHCSGSCAFTQGDPNEHLVRETPFYNYAVVIDYNTAAPIKAGAGSAFFLHVTNGTPTAGCISIPQANLVALMQWLSPASSPRILIGTG